MGDSMQFDRQSEQGVVLASMSSLTANTASSGSILQQTFTRLAGDASASWLIAMQTPTFNQAAAQRMVTESGSGYARQGVPQSPPAT